MRQHTSVWNVWMADNDWTGGLKHWIYYLCLVVIFYVCSVSIKSAMVSIVLTSILFFICFCVFVFCWCFIFLSLRLYCIIDSTV